jgi:transglutaminase-like putative cysteine protease
MRITVRHEVTLRFAASLRYSIQYLRLTPRSDAGQRVIDWRIDAPGRQWRQTDAYGNIIVVTSLDRRHDEVRVIAQGLVETYLAPQTPMSYPAGLPPQVFLVPTALTQADEAIREIADASIAPDDDREKATERMMKALIARVAASSAGANGQASAASVLAKGEGGPADQTHLFLACARAAGIPARYVSGFLGEGGGVGAHAWADVWITGRGWISIDPSLATYPGASYCRLAVGRDAMDAAPVRDAHLGVGGESVTSAAITRGNAPAEAEQQ